MRPQAFQSFSKDALTFLRRLRRNNNREWFQAHREEYERDVRAPMFALIERLASDLSVLTPELVAAPRVSMYRIHRDTRFSPDKSPYKTNAAAVFPHRDLAKHQGAGLYLEVGPDRVLIGGGIYAPGPLEIQQLRSHLASHYTTFRTLVESPEFRRTLGTVTGETLTRVPRGFATDHPAAQYLKLRQFLAGREYPALFATEPGFYRVVLRTFRRLAPIIRFLNTPLLAAQRALADPLRDPAHQLRRT